MDRIDKYKILTKSQIRLFIITKRPFTNQSLVEKLQFCFVLTTVFLIKHTM